MSSSSSHEKEPAVDSPEENVTNPSTATAVDDAEEEQGKTSSVGGGDSSEAEFGVREHLIIVVSCLLTISFIHLFLTRLLGSSGKFFDLIPAWYITVIGFFFTLLAFLGHMSRKILRRFRK